MTSFMNSLQYSKSFSSIHRWINSRNLSCELITSTRCHSFSNSRKLFFTTKKHLSFQSESSQIKTSKMILKEVQSLIQIMKSFKKNLKMKSDVLIIRMKFTHLLLSNLLLLTLYKKCLISRKTK